MNHLSNIKLRGAISELSDLAQRTEELKREFRPLEVGCVVTTVGGDKITITKVLFGEDAISKCNFYRWHVCFPYDMEHAAMGHKDGVASVDWPSE